MDLSELRFLVAEDQAYQRRCIVRMLYGMGAKGVTEAADSVGTLQVFRHQTHRFDVIICDLDMPGVGGLEFLNGISQVKGAASVIFTSGLDPIMLESVGARAKGQGLRVIAMLQKPLTPEKLMNALHGSPGTEDRTHQSPQQAPSPGMRQLLAVLKGGQLEPWCEPRVSFASARLLGVQSLARWRDEALGLLEPVAFVPAIERHGLMGALTWAMLEQSARACRSWRDAGLAAGVSVRVCPVVLREPDLAGRLERRVKGWGLAPALLTLEVDETSVMSQQTMVMDNLMELRMSGFGLSLEDYGRGLCSAQQISRIPFTELKLERSLVSGIDAEPYLEKTVGALVESANRYGIATIAQDVRTHGEWELLAHLGCDAAQGPYIATPMDEASLGRWMHERNAPVPKAA